MELECLGCPLLMVRRGPVATVPAEVAQFFPNQVWVGDADGGLQLHLRGPSEVWDVVTLHRTGLPESWANDGKGGCDVTETGDTVLIRAYSGNRQLQPGSSLEFRWKALGLDAAKAKLTAPPIDHFQNSAEFSPQGEIPLEPAKGWLLILENQ